MSNAQQAIINGSLKKRLIQGGVGVSIAVLIGIFAPMMFDQSNRIGALEIKQERISTEIEPIKKLPDEVEKLKGDIKDLKTLFILVNKDNPDLKNYLELNK